MSLTPDRLAALSALDAEILSVFAPEEVITPDEVLTILQDTVTPFPAGVSDCTTAICGAGIVNAGGFLINRFAPVFVHTGDVLHWVFIVGLVTAVIGSAVDFQPSGARICLSEDEVASNLAASSGVVPFLRVVNHSSSFW